MARRQADIDKELSILANHMRDRRRALGLTQEELAEMAGLSANYVARIELGLRTPSLSTTVRLARALGLEVSYTLADEDTKWLDEAQKMAYALRSLPDSEAKFLIEQFHAIREHIRGLLKH